MEINKSQREKIALLFAAIAAVGGLTALLLYSTRKKNAKLQSEILQLDKEIKQLQLSSMKKSK